MRSSRKSHLLSFTVPFLSMIIILALQGVFPFGGVTFMSKDYYHQYAPFFYEYHRKLSSFESLQYSWNAGLGSNFLPIIAYYLSSPFNLFLGILPEEWIVPYESFLVVLKTGLMGLTMSIYLKAHFRAKAGFEWVFGTAYALSGFMCAYNFNLMWLDVLVLTPLVVLGLERLYFDNDPHLYAISLSLSIFSNYYLSIMLCLYLLIYFIVLSLGHGIKTIAAMKFFWYSLLSGVLSSILIIPEAHSLLSSKFSRVASPPNFELYYMNPFRILERLFFLSPPETGLGHLPNIYFSEGALILLIIYFFSDRERFKSTRRIKTLNLLLVLLFFLSFNISSLSFIWHGFNYPDSLPARESYLFIFLSLSLCCEAFYKLREIRKERIYLSLTVFVLLFTLGALFGFTLKERLLPAGIFAILYAALMILAKKTKPKNLIIRTFGCLIIAEVFLNMKMTNTHILSRYRAFEFDKDYKTLLSYARIRENASGQPLYRTEEIDKRVINHSLTLGYPSLSLFLSPSSYLINNYARRYGIRNSRVLYLSEGTTPLTAAFLCQRYCLVPNGSHYFAGDTATEIMAAGGSKLYEMDFHFPFGYASHQSLEHLFSPIEGGSFPSLPSPGDESPAELQNKLLSAFEIQGEFLEDITDSEYFSLSKAEIEFKEAAHLYLYNDKRMSCDLSLGFNDGGKPLLYESMNHQYFLDLGYHLKGTRIEITAVGEANNASLDDLSLFKLNTESLMQLRSQINSSERLEKMEILPNGLSGKISMEKDGHLILSIPYENGWTLSVDGVQADMELFDGLLISVPLSQGQHEIALSFEAPGFKVGLIVSLTSLLILSASLFYEKSLMEGRMRI
ncbi:MAG: YfhO family protein [Lachnospiraceae bacterium]|nr:YfhO family protein [Lachnospiraceae bacterium]